MLFFLIKNKIRNMLVIHTDGNFHDILYTDGGVGKTQTSGHIKMEGKDVFKHAVEKLSSSFIEALNKANLSTSDIDWLIPHQANQRIINAVGEKLGFNENKIISTVYYHGNTSAASIPLALDHAINKKIVKNGDFIGLQAIGGGLSWGSSVIKYGKPTK